MKRTKLKFPKKTLAVVTAAVVCGCVLYPQLTTSAMPSFDKDAIESYADYGLHEVAQKPLIDFNFEGMTDTGENVTNAGKAEGDGRISPAAGAALIPGRYDLGQALNFTAADTCVTGPSLGELNALTFSAWLKIKDVQTRADTDQPRVTTLLDTKAGSGRVTLKLVHTGVPPKKVGNEIDQGNNSTKLVFAIEGNAGGDFENTGVAANNQRFYEYEYTFSDKAQSWTSHPETHCWVNVSVVYDPAAKAVTFYTNGKLDSTKTFTTAVKPALNDIRFGAGNAANAYLDGAIDDIRIYDEALNAADIEALADFERDMWANRTAGDWEDSTTTLYVDGTNGSDDNDGSKASPFATVKKGVEAISAPGTRLIIAPGVYREAAITLNASGTETKPIIIEAEKPGETIISGSTVLTDWQLTTTPDVYSHAWTFKLPKYSCAGNEFALRTDMLIIDGEPMEPVFNLADLKLNTYYLNETTKKIYVKTKKLVDKFIAEVPNLGVNKAQALEGQLFKMNSQEYVVMRGLTFTDAATTIHGNGVDLGLAKHVLIEDCAFNKSNGNGLGAENAWGDEITEDIMIRRCSFDKNGYGAFAAGFRAMNVVLENCEATNTGWKVLWGEYTAADPATMKFMFTKNVNIRHNRFDESERYDLWFDNTNWNIDINGNSFTNCGQDAVFDEINPAGVQIRNNSGGGVKIGNSEGTIIDNNIFYSTAGSLLNHWGFEVRYDGNNAGGINQGGPGLTFKDTILTNNIFALADKSQPMVYAPPWESFYKATAAGNQFYVQYGAATDPVFHYLGKTGDFAGFTKAIHDETAQFITENPFLDDGTATISFKDKASVSGGDGMANYVPVVVSKPLRKEVRVSYTIWDYDAKREIRSGELKFDQFNRQKEIYVGAENKNILIELTGAKDISLGEQTLHFQAKV